MVGHESVEVPSSKMKIEIAEILRKEGFVEGYELEDEGKVGAKIRLNLHYWSKGEPAITGLQRISKPGLRRYSSNAKLPIVYGNRGVAVMSTNKGLMTGFEAKKNGVGGEVLFYVW
jgi:small subunit ribosomal protein S8|tara:strand:- start:1372 stop:1719 length:348 start_codon:yes stop_codon:yes gene_type:complete